MANADSLLLWSGVVFLLASLTTILFCLLRRCWRKEGYQLTVLILFLLGVMAMFWAFEVKEKVPRFLFDGVTLTLATFAIAFALWQFRDARRQQREMTTIAGQMATRFAGFFPNNLQEINQVIRKAQKGLDVMSDYVGYGHYSAPLQFDLYFRTLLDLAGQNVAIRMLVYARDTAQEMHEVQFISDTLKDLEKWAQLKKFCKRYETNFESALWEKIRTCDSKITAWNQKMKDGNNPSAQESGELDTELASLRVDFDRLMFDRQLMYMKELLERGIEIKKTPEKLPFFMWCEDRHEAVFAFLHETSKEEREVSFLTRDSRFVADSFEKKFDYLFKNAEQIKLINVAGQLEPDWLPPKNLSGHTPVRGHGLSGDKDE
jgi:hypothetical protein